MKRFEYTTRKTHTPMTEYELNRLGEHGWELITIEPPGTVYVAAYRYVFKRETSTNYKPGSSEISGSKEL